MKLIFSQFEFNHYLFSAVVIIIFYYLTFLSFCLCIHRNKWIKVHLQQWLKRAKKKKSFHIMWRQQGKQWQHLECERDKYQPLLLFLFLWHCLGVHIYWEFSLEQAMTGPRKTRWGTKRNKEFAERKSKRTEKSIHCKVSCTQQKDLNLQHAGSNK